MKIENFKRLVRNLRQKNHEKLDIQRSVTTVISGKESTKDIVSPTVDSDKRRK